MANHFDLIDRTPLDVVEGRAIGNCRLRSQLVTAGDEIEPKVLRQDRLCRLEFERLERDLAVGACRTVLSMKVMTIAPSGLTNSVLPHARMPALTRPQDYHLPGDLLDLGNRCRFCPRHARRRDQQ
jgi:hypothetical protein